MVSPWFHTKKIRKPVAFWYILEPMADNYINYFAETDFRGQRRKFGIKVEDRARHVYIIGKTGMGKSTILENMAVQDIQHGEGIAFIDPHGGTAEKLLDYIPPERMKDVIYMAPHDLEFPVAFNIMENLGKDKNYLVANGLIATFKKIWPDVWSARMEYILNNVLLALLEYPDSTILGVNRMLADVNYRQAVVDNITDASVKSFWVDEFANYTERMAAESVPAIQNKIGQFTSNPLIRNIVGQPKSTFDLRDVMDNKKILIMNLSKGRVGEINANLLGGMLITKIYLAAMSRADKNAAELRDLPSLYFYVDEFQSFVNETFADILSEARKYKLALTMAHQYIEQMPEEVRDAVFGNVGTTIANRVGPLDAEILEKLFTPTFLIEDIVSLGRFQMYLTLMVDGVGSKPFSARGMPPIPPPAESLRALVIENSRALYARPRAQVEADITKWHEPIGGSAGSGVGEGGERPRLPRKRPEGGGSRGGQGGSGGGYSRERSSLPRERSEAPRPRSEGPRDRSSPAPARRAFGESMASGPARRLPPRDAEPVSSPQTQPMSLKSLSDRGGSPSNLNTLRSTLKSVLDKERSPRESAPASQAVQKQTALLPNASGSKASGPVLGQPAVEKRTEQPPKAEQERPVAPPVVEKPQSPKTKEIPEDELRRMLDVDMPSFQ